VSFFLAEIERFATINDLHRAIVAKQALAAA
jgi:hypothetical protein